MTEPLQPTPLNAFHTALGARMGAFAGWSLPLQYTSHAEEHLAVRQAAGLFDVSHMAEFSVEGDGAGAWLNRLVSSDVGQLRPGRARYGLLCNAAGGTIDDVIVMHLEDRRWLVVANAANRASVAAWLRAQAEAGVRCEDASEAWALLALQGPAALRIAEAAGLSPDSLPGRRFGCVQTTWQDSALIVSRTGYTGEDGLELFVAPERAEALAQALLEAGQPLGLKPCGLVARDSLRTEAGLSLYGHELGAEISPVDAGLGWAIAWDKPGGFIGQRALLPQRDRDAPRTLCWWVGPDRRMIRAGAAVTANGGYAGTVASGSFSPLLQRSIGSAWLQAPDTAQHTHTDALPTRLEVSLRGKMAVLDVRQPPLHRAT